MAFDAAAKKGSAFLLQKGATTIGGFRQRSLSIKTDTVDVTTADDTNRYRQLLAAAAIKSLSFTGDGVLKDTAAQQALITDILAQTLDTYTVTIPGVGTFAGNWTISGVDMSGAYNAEGTFTITIESAADITFTAEG